MSDFDWTKMAEMTVENGECAAQLEIIDKELRGSLIREIIFALQRAYAFGKVDEQS